MGVVVRVVLRIVGRVFEEVVDVGGVVRGFGVGGELGPGGDMGEHLVQEIVMC